MIGGSGARTCGGVRKCGGERRCKVGGGCAGRDDRQLIGHAISVERERSIEKDTFEKYAYEGVKLMGRACGILPDDIEQIDEEVCIGRDVPLWREFDALVCDPDMDALFDVSEIKGIREQTMKVVLLELFETFDLFRASHQRGKWALLAEKRVKTFCEVFEVVGGEGFVKIL